MRGRTLEEKRALHGNSPVMSVLQLADYLQCHTSTIYRMLRRGDFDGCKLRIGSDYRFIKSAVDTWIAARVNANGTE